MSAGEDLRDLECHACPGAGACGGQFDQHHGLRGPS